MKQKEEYRKNEFELNPVTITDNQEVSPGVYLLSWKRQHDFLPGQVVKITNRPDFPPRIYSVCCGNHEAEIRVLFNVKDEGELTPYLSGLIPGGQILVSKPYGSFIGTHQPAWWIATGTGIAPFYSMFQSGLSENKTLIHGVRFLNQFYFEDELDWAMGERYIRCCSGEKSCNTFPGRVTEFLQNTEHLPTEINYYLCGKALMVVEVRDLLIDKGVPYGNIYAEIYF